MATARAIANGNWSATSTWNGGVLPGNGDTVYANGFNVTINQDINIGGANNPTVNAGSFVSGQWYEVLFVGTTSWTGIGAASNTAGTIFLATGAGTGTGNARALATLTTAANTPAGAAAGGSFAMSSPFAITTDLRAGTTACLSVTGATALTLDGLRVVGGTLTSAHACNYAGTTTCTLANATFTAGGNGSAFNNASTGTVNVSSSCTFSGGGGGATAFNNASNGTVNVSSSCTFTGGSNTSSAFTNAGANGTVNVSASCTFTGAGSSNPAFTNASTGTVNVSASCTFTGGSGTNAFALNNALTGTVIVTQGTFTASAFANAVSATNTGADVRLSGDFLDHWSGWKAVNSPRFRLGTAPTLGQTRFALAGTTDSYFSMYGADNGSFGNPIAANVRSGVVYGGGNLTGTCAVPAAGSVALGVPVDAGFGTAVLTTANVQSALTAQGLTTARAGALDNLDTAVSSRLAPSGTLATVTTLTNAPSVPTPSQIASQVRTELTSELSNLDASVSSRLAGSAYTAPSTPPTAADIASAVWAAADKTGYSLTSAERSAIAAAVESSILNEGDGQAVLNAIVGAIGNSNVDQIALVAAIRADLERTGGKLINLDATISSRLAATDYNAPTSAPTAASVANAVWGAASRTITGGVVDTLTNAPASVTPSDIWSHATRTLTSASGPTAIEIRQEIDGNSTQLSAIKSKTDALPSDPADQSLLEAAIAGVTAPSAATVAAAVRSELSVELARVDQAVSSRLAASEASKLDAVKAKTDLLQTDRLAQCSTVATTGAQLAAALS
jgi:hypothetical protein